MAAAIFCCLLLVPLSSPGGDGENPSPARDDTMLMFVGEDVEVLSIASRREESARQAPAIAHVVTGQDIRERGVTTLARALGMMPGFYMAQKEWGVQPYLRGIPDSILFLYDTVPMGSDVTKSARPLDHELSLATVKRIEIIRGPGSVLWGPDAFAGIVNVVPMTGKDLDGAEAGILYETPGDQKGFYANLGYDNGLWDVFLSVSGRRGQEDDTPYNLDRFWGDGDTPVPAENRSGHGEPGWARYLEFVGNFSFRDWLTVSARVSENKRPYAMTEPEMEITWPESRGAPSGFFKLEAKKALDHASALRFSGFYSWLNPECEIIDRTLEQKERTLYGEVIYDRSFLTGRGLFTGGLSYRRKDIENAPVWDSYVPGYLGPENREFLPLSAEEDYHAGLFSLFGQYTHKIGDLDLWLGLRQDEHDEYRDHLSYNLGAAWSISPEWVAKLLYGTAYRTPFARQLLEEEEPEPEEIKSVCAQIGWRPSGRAGITLSGFTGRIRRHIKEDPYAGLSSPNTQRIRGLEIEGRISPLRGLDLSTNLTLMRNSGPDETYRYNDYTIIRPDGTVEEHYVDLRYPYDSGPDTLFNLTGTWRPFERFTAFARLGYFSSRKLIYPKATGFRSTPGAWLLDVSATIKDLVFAGVNLTFTVENLFDRDYDTPGTYTTIEGKPRTALVMLSKRW